MKIKMNESVTDERENKDKGYKEKHLENCLNYFAKKWDMTWQKVSNYYVITSENINPSWAKFYIFPVKNTDLSSRDSVYKLSKESVNASISDKIICTMGPNKDEQFMSGIERGDCSSLDLHKDDDEELTKLEISGVVSGFIKMISRMDEDIADRNEEAASQTYNKEKEKETIRDDNAKKRAVQRARG